MVIESCTLSTGMCNLKSTNHTKTHKIRTLINNNVIENSHMFISSLSQPNNHAESSPFFCQISHSILPVENRGKREDAKHKLCAPHDLHVLFRGLSPKKKYAQCLKKSKKQSADTPGKDYWRLLESSWRGLLWKLGENLHCRKN